MNINTDIIISRIKLYLYFVICFVLSVIIIGVANSNNLEINSMFIFVVSLVIISLYLLERFTFQKILLDSNVDLSENTTNKIELKEPHEINEAVITVPASFTNEQRLETKKAAELAGIKVNYMIDEPTADNEHYIKLREGFNNLSDEFRILRQDIEKKEKEIARYREGYDANTVKGYFSKFTSVDSLIKEYINDNEIDFEGLNVIQTQMEEALAEYDIEIFYPELGDDYRTAIGVAELTRKQKIETHIKDEHFKIAKVIKPGYRRKIDVGLSDNNSPQFQIITDAKVAVYVFNSPQ
jgi:hypothetical protein